MLNFVSLVNVCTIFCVKSTKDMGNNNRGDGTQDDT